MGNKNEIMNRSIKLTHVYKTRPDYPPLSSAFLFIERLLKGVLFWWKNDKFQS